MPDPAKSQALSQSLQQSLRRRRPSRGWLLLVLLALMASTAAAWYWAATRQAPPEPIVLALDDVATLGKEGELHAVFLAPKGSHDATPFEGRPLLIKKQAESDGVTYRADARNHVKVRVDSLKHDVPFLIQYHSQERRQFPFEDQATLFVWPAETRVLVVDVDSALLALDETALRPGASNSLLALHKAGMRIVYVTLDPADAETAVPRRKQVRLFQHELILPTGPILLRLQQPGESVDAALASILTRLSKSFTHPPYVIVGSDELAHKCRTLGGVAPILLSDAHEATGVPRCPTWSDVRRELIDR